MRKALLVCLLASLQFLPATGAIAATKTPAPPIAISSLTPNLVANFVGGDQISQLITSPSAIYLVGTVESLSFPVVTGAQLGGSDGFITSLNSQGSKIWDLRLGGTGDDVATSGSVDTNGNIWVVGASAQPSTPGTSSSGLNRLTVWEISAAGVLLNTFSKDLMVVAVPTSIAANGLNYLIRGLSSAKGQPTFSLTLTSLGQFGEIKTSSLPASNPATIFSAVSSAYTWQSLVTNSAIKGVTGLPAHQSTPILSKSSLKDKSLKGVYSVQGVPQALQYQAGLGVVLLSQNSTSYFVTVVHTK